MKKFIIILLLILTYDSYAQEISPPYAVKANFENEFKNAIDSNWSIFYRGKDKTQLRYEVEFIKGNSKYLVSYQNDGTMRAIEKSMAVSKLKKEIKNYLKNEYRTFDVNQASIIVKDSKDVFYNVGISDDSNYIILVFNEAGVYLYLTPLGERI